MAAVSRAFLCGLGLRQDFGFHPVELFVLLQGFTSLRGAGFRGWRMTEGIGNAITRLRGRLVDDLLLSAARNPSRGLGCTQPYKEAKDAR